MTKLGWAILTVILFVAIAFASMLSFGGPPREPPREATVPIITRGALLVPVQGVARTALRDTWGEARAGGMRTHHGTDIAAARGTPVIAASPGIVEKLFVSRDGGTTLYLRSADRRLNQYYAHLAGYAPGIREGVTVRAGQVIGYVGDSGNAGAGNTHLHFGLSRMRRGDRWWQGEPVNPYPLLAGNPPVR